MSQDAQDVMNLPDDILKQKKESSSKSKTVQDMLEDLKQKQKKEALSRINSKITHEQSNKPASELYNMKMVIPDEDNAYQDGEGDQYDNDEMLVTINQQNLNDDEFQEFFEDDQVKPQWNVNINEFRNTEFVPTCSYE